MTQESEQGKAARYLAHVRRDGETLIPHDLGKYSVEFDTIGSRG